MSDLIKREPELLLDASQAGVNAPAQRAIWLTGALAAIYSCPPDGVAAALAADSARPDQRKPRRLSTGP